jgi:hypothetical protein
MNALPSVEPDCVAPPALPGTNSAHAQRVHLWPTIPRNATATDRIAPFSFLPETHP